MKWGASAGLSLLAAAALLVGCPATGMYDFDGDGSADNADCAPEDPEIHPPAAA